MKDTGAVRNRPIDRTAVHPNCVVCSPGNTRGLHLAYKQMPNGRVEATFPCQEELQGYQDRLHGGMIAALLDGAMTHCLFAQGLAAVTAELTVRYRYPVAVRRMATIHAWLERAARHLQVVRAELRQDGVIKASARAKFMKNEP